MFIDFCLDARKSLATGNTSRHTPVMSRAGMRQPLLVEAVVELGATIAAVKVTRRQLSIHAKVDLAEWCQSWQVGAVVTMQAVTV